MISTIGSASDVYAGATEKFIEDGSGNREFFIPGTLKQEFGREISGAKDDYLFNFGMNVSDLVFVVGGAYGFSKEVYERADALISLSKMTFSHQMVRAIFLEQLKGGTDETVCPSFFVHSPRKPFNTIGYDSWRSKRD